MMLVLLFDQVVLKRLVAEEHSKSRIVPLGGPKEEPEPAAGIAVAARCVDED